MTNILCIGWNYEEVNGKICEYWVHALCLGFPDVEDETFENILFRCPPHNQVNIASASSKKKSSSLLKSEQLNCILPRENTVIIKRMSRSWCEFEQKSKWFILMNFRLLKIFTFFEYASASWCPLEKGKQLWKHI